MYVYSSHAAAWPRDVEYGRAGLFTSVAAVTPGPLVENARTRAARHTRSHTHTLTPVLHNYLAREVCVGATALTHHG